MLFLDNYFKSLKYHPSTLANSIYQSNIKYNIFANSISVVFPEILALKQVKGCV